MNHPYSGAASYIYANEHPYTPVDPQSRNPYGKLPSFIPSPSSIISNPIPIPRKSHDSGWSTEGTYTRTQRPKYDDGDAPPLRRGLSHPRPPIPLRAPVSHPYQQQAGSASWVNESTNATYIRPQVRSTSLPGHSRAPNMKMTPYGRDGDPLSLRRSAFVPYEPRPFEREAAGTSWRRRIQVALEQRRIRRLIKRLRRLMHFKS